MNRQIIYNADDTVTLIENERSVTVLLNGLETVVASFFMVDG